MRRLLRSLKGRRSFAASNFREVVKLAISRMEGLKEERSNKCSANLQSIQVFIPYHPHPSALNLALHRCGDFIKNQNRLDAYIIIEGYLNLLIERIDLFGNGRDCPAELKEAASGVVFAATRCKEIPELQEIKSILTSRFGREFIGRAVELRSSANVSDKLKLAEKLSEMRPSPESKMNLLKAIASQKSQQPQPPPPPPPPNQEQMTREQIWRRSWSKRGMSEMIETSSSVFGSEDSSNSSGSRKKKSKVVGLKISPTETSLDSFYTSTQTGVKPSSSNQTTQKSKGVGFKNTSLKPTGVKNLLSSKQTKQKNKVVPLNITPTPTNFDPETRRYQTRSSSKKR